MNWYVIYVFACSICRISFEIMHRICLQILLCSPETHPAPASALSQPPLVVETLCVARMESSIPVSAK